MYKIFFPGRLSKNRFSENGITNYHRIHWNLLEPFRSASINFNRRLT